MDMNNIKVFRLAYAMFGSLNIEKMVQYYTETIGYRLSEKTEDGSAYLSNGLDHHNIVLTPHKHKGIKRYGYQLDGKLSIGEVQEELKKQGIHSQIKSDEQPGVREMLEVKDPDGNVIELFTEMDMPATGYGNTGIVPHKLGHIAFYAKNMQKTIQFYEEALGFMFTDTIGDNFANFLTCNHDHHTLNIVSSNKSNQLHHIAFELKDSSHQYLSSEVLAKHGYEIIWGPSRHTSGHNIATYHYDPDGNVVELFIDMDRYIPELGIFEPKPWHEELPLTPRRWEGLSSWGTEFEVDLANV
ncbi:VOC family protein [Oceanobacillus longus]|uniref:VOC family protein n=1 Tax=Oceanobacillus longus TaxID=930120 RepID=A0ABV8H2H0_9BACI